MIIDEGLSLLLQTVLSWILRTVLIMSAAGSVLALILFALKPVLAKPEDRIVSKAARYWAWKIVLAAFLVPFSLLLTVPVYTPTTEIQNIIEGTIIPNQERFDEIIRVDTGKDKDLQRLNELRSQWWVDYLKFITLDVSLVLFAKTRIQYRTFARKLRSARLPAREEDAAILEQLASSKNVPALYRNPLVPTAMLVGVFRPTIYLPDCNYSETQLENILLHELTHYRRHDVLVKWFSVLLTQLHWFNPLAYLVRRELNRACELSCDAAAIKDFDNRKKQEYGDTLISVAAEAKIPNSMISTAVCEEKKNLKDRLTAIMNSRKATRFGMVFSCVFVVLILCITVVFAAAPTTKVIDPSSVIYTARMCASPDIDFSAPAMFEHVPFDAAFLDLYEKGVYSETDADTLIHLINSYRKTIYKPSSVQPVSYGDSTWIQINCEDGGHYLLNYWRYRGFSFNPLHPGEDKYCSLLTYFDAKGNIGTTWKLEYDFDNAFAVWRSSGGLQSLSGFEKEAAESKAKTWKAVVSLDDYYSVEEVSAWIEEYGITVNRVYMWPEGETGRLSLYVEDGNLQNAAGSFRQQTEGEGLLRDEQIRKDYERFLSGEYKVFALTIASPDGMLPLLEQLKVLKWDIGCADHVDFMDSGNSRELPVKPDGAL